MIRPPAVTTPTPPDHTSPGGHHPQYAQGPYQPGPSYQPPAAASSRWPFGIAMLVAGLVLGVVVTLAGTAAGSLGSTTMKGTLTLVGVSSSCVGYGGYSDINQGAPVTVRDADGKVVATGQLDSGQFKQPVSCVYPFSVEVPRSDFYSVEVSHRGQLTFDRDAVERGNVSLTLGT